MNLSRLAGALALAAFAAAPAFAQTDSNSTVHGASVAPLDKAAAKQNAAAPDKQLKADSKRSSDMSANANVNSPTVDGAYVAPTEVAAAKQHAALDCADHPQAGKLADKSTGMAKEHSASAVHQDCVNTAKAKPAKKKSTKTASTETK